jgi:hypothetical protein
VKTVVAVNDTDLAEAFNRVADAWQEKWVYWPGSLLLPTTQKAYQDVKLPTPLCPLELAIST